MIVGLFKVHYKLLFDVWIMAVCPQTKKLNARFDVATDNNDGKTTL